MVQEHIDLMRVLDKGGLVSMYDGRYLVVKEVGEEGDAAEWFVILADTLEDALSFGGSGETAVFSATPYLSRKEALQEAYGVLPG